MMASWYDEQLTSLQMLKVADSNLDMCQFPSYLKRQRHLMVDAWREFGMKCN